MPTETIANDPMAHIRKTLARCNASGMSARAVLGHPSRAKKSMLSVWLAKHRTGGHLALPNAAMSRPCEAVLRKVAVAIKRPILSGSCVVDEVYRLLLSANYGDFLAPRSVSLVPGSYRIFPRRKIR
jgi:hypothetical protein